MKQYLYTNQKDGRSRVVIVDGDKHTSKSYPRFIVEKTIGRDLFPDEDVHHIDGDVTNNDISNLEVIKHCDHQRMHAIKYSEKNVVCDVCGKSFIYSQEQVKQYNCDLRRGRKRFITCSKRCAGIAGARK